MNDKKHISVINWMLTLPLCVIPGVNIIAMLLFLLLGRSRSKKTFAVAVLLWTLILALLLLAVVLLFPVQVRQLCVWLDQYAAMGVAEIT